MITAIIQARMNSARLPGKVLKQINGLPLLHYLIERVKKAQHIEQMIVATTTDESDEPIRQFCINNCILYFCGSVEDVLDRFYQAAKLHNATLIIRITADCPLFDPSICDMLIERSLCQNGSYVRTGQTFPEGLDCEVFSFEILEKCWQSAKLASEREHVTLYIHNYPETFHRTTIEDSENNEQYRFTVDEEEDFVVLSHIILELSKVRDISLVTKEEILSFFKSHPQIANINHSIQRNEGLLISLAKENNNG